MSRPKKAILYVHHRRELGGAPASLARLIQSLDHERFEPHVYCPPGKAAELFRSVGADVHTGTVASFTHIWASTYRGLRWLLLVRELSRLPAHAVGFRRVLRSAPFRIVHLNDSPLIPAAYLARRRGIPIVWHLRSALPTTDGTRSRVMRRAIRRLSNTSIAITEDVAASFGVGSEVIANSVDLERFTPAAVPPTVPTVGFVGFLYPWKGFREFLQAAALVHARMPATQFVVLGGAVRDSSFFVTPLGRILALLGLARDYDAEAARLADELGIREAVRFLPYTPDPAPIYRENTVIVAPSQGPELGRPVIEAAACGIPVIATGSSSGGGILLPGTTGILVTHGTPEQLANAVCELLSDPGRRALMGAKARAHAEQTFDPDTNARTVQALYASLIGELELTGSADGT